MIKLALVFAAMLSNSHIVALSLGGIPEASYGGEVKFHQSSVVSKDRENTVASGALKFPIIVTDAKSIANPKGNYCALGSVILSSGNAFHQTYDLKALIHQRYGDSLLFNIGEGEAQRLYATLSNIAVKNFGAIFVIQNVPMPIDSKNIGANYLGGSFAAIDNYKPSHMTDMSRLRSPIFNFKPTNSNYGSVFEFDGSAFRSQYVLGLSGHCPSCRESEGYINNTRQGNEYASPSQHAHNHRPIRHSSLGGKVSIGGVMFVAGNYLMFYAVVQFAARKITPKTFTLSFISGVLLMVIGAILSVSVFFT